MQAVPGENIYINLARALNDVANRFDRFRVETLSNSIEIRRISRLRGRPFIRSSISHSSPDVGLSERATADRKLNDGVTEPFCFVGRLERAARGPMDGWMDRSAVGRASVRGLIGRSESPVRFPIRRAAIQVSTNVGSGNVSKKRCRHTSILHGVFWGSSDKKGNKKASSIAI